MCSLCGESAEVCDCSEDDETDKFKKCGDCDGTGKICVVHESPYGSTRKDGLCDAAKKIKESTVSSTT